MLYVNRIAESRYSFGRSYGIVDTDDGTETVVGWKELEEITCGQHPVQILGVRTKPYSDYDDNGYREWMGLDEVEVYTGPGRLSPSQIRRV